MIKFFGKLIKSKLTWIDGNGIRCFADFCYRESTLDDGAREVISVIAERGDNPGLNIISSANEVIEAVISRFPASTGVVVHVRYDQSSDESWQEEPRRSRYVQFCRSDAVKPVQFRKIPDHLREFFDKHWDI